MIVCHRCNKENQNHYKFCLGCGAELTSAAPTPKADVGMMNTMLAEPGQQPNAVAAPVQPVGDAERPPSAGHPAPIANATPVAAMPNNPPSAGRSPDSSGSAIRQCPSCKSEIPPAFKFCGVCGFRLEEAAPPPQAATEVKASNAIMTLIRPDGSEGGVHQLQEGENKIGRNHGEIFENDGYLSPTHAVLTVDTQNQKAVIQDLGSLNGIFVRMTNEEAIVPGQIIRIGQELLRFDIIEAPRPLDDGTEIMGSPNPGYWGKLSVIIGNGVSGSAYPLLGPSITLGRERGEINFPDDGYVSGLHARLSNQNGTIILADLGSSNGTFIKVKKERELIAHSFVLLGQQLFRLSFDS